MNNFSFSLGLALGVIATVIFFFFKNRAEKASGTRLKEELEQTFKSVAGDVLQNANRSFLDLAKTQLAQEAQTHQSQMDLAKKEVEFLVKPLAESLQIYKKEINEMESKRSKDQGSLDGAMRMILETNQKLRDETQQLVNALKRPTVRGRWGEVQLKRIVELAGLSRHCDFSEQVSVNTEDGRLRPDMVIRLPNGRDIVVDSKAVLEGYLEAESLRDDVQRKVALQKHAQALKTRITELSKKSYWDQFKNTPEFVVLFIPGEAFFSAALEEMPDLVEYGFSQKVVLATPTTLMALLRAVAFGWRQEQLAENAKKISEQASRLYQGLSSWMSHLQDVGTHVGRAAKSYNNAVGSLERTVAPPIRRLKDLGVSAKDEVKIPEVVESTIRDVQVALLED